ncbi:MAG: hypothetical protein AB1634_09425 [Thermodesulfobacteriota bacterium]
MARKEDIEVARIEAGSRKFSATCDTVKHIITVIGVLVALHIAFEGIRPFLESRPEIIDALARLAGKVNVGNITGYVIGAISGGAWYLERRGKKRAIARKGQYQRRAEAGDIHRSSSGLTPTGDTPKEDA